MYWCGAAHTLCLRRLSMGMKVSHVTLELCACARAMKSARGDVQRDVVQAQAETRAVWPPSFTGNSPPDGVRPKRAPPARLRERTWDERTARQVQCPGGSPPAQRCRPSRSSPVHRRTPSPTSQPPAFDIPARTLMTRTPTAVVSPTHSPTTTIVPRTWFVASEASAA